MEVLHVCIVQRHDGIVGQMRKSMFDFSLGVLVKMVCIDEQDVY